MPVKKISLDGTAITVVDENGNDTGQRLNPVLYCMGLIVNNAVHRNDTDAMIAFEIGEKISEPQLGEIRETIELNESEITFVRYGINNLRERLPHLATGKNWYWLIKALENVTPAEQNK